MVVLANRLIIGLVRIMFCRCDRMVPNLGGGVEW